MNDATITRREVLTGALPAAAILGAGLFPGIALAQGSGQQQPRGPIEQMLAEAFADGQYQLPKLPYATDALEPHLDARTIQLHHDKHHKAYVDGLNKAAKAIAELPKGSEIDPSRL